MFKAIVQLLAAIGGFLISSWLFLWLWNMLVPQVFGLPIISYAQALGLNFLIALPIALGTTKTKTEE